jgi:hypothetical protein
MREFNDCHLFSVVCFLETGRIIWESADSVSSQDGNGIPDSYEESNNNSNSGEEQPNPQSPQSLQVSQNTNVNFGGSLFESKTKNGETKGVYGQFKLENTGENKEISLQLGALNVVLSDEPRPPHPSANFYGLILGIALGATRGGADLERAWER